MTISPELAAPPGTEPAERGSLQIDASVIRKIVEHATDQMPGTLRATRRVAGVAVRENGSNAKVWVGAEYVDLRLTVALRYPGSVTAAVGQVRARVAEDIERMTGLRVRGFEVTVAGLYRDTPTRLL
ncbi:MAG TPA: Asp23/Gls24 family envelope stress response protein [Pseudonocardia sp.]|jgi:uncharacterized alkaline shock family protein YloU